MELPAFQSTFHCPEAVRWGTWRVKRVPIFTWTRAGGVLRAVLINPLTDGTILKEDRGHPESHRVDFVVGVQGRVSENRHPSRQG